MPYGLFLPALNTGFWYGQLISVIKHSNAYGIATADIPIINFNMVSHSCMFIYIYICVCVCVCVCVCFCVWSG
jgi:hypothetical protein